MSQRKVLIIIFLFCTGTESIRSKNLNASERNARLNFIRNILSRGKDQEGAVKLVGGPSRYEGNVHIWHSGRWGAVCHDSWDDLAAGVVCSKFNRSGVATRGSQYGYSKVKYWMNNVICEGQETSLTQCSFSGWGDSDCDPNKAAGVKCLGDPDPEPVAQPLRRWPGKVLRQVLDVRNAKIRLAGGRDETEGRVEIQYEGAWGSICGDGWTLYEALVTCRHLGLGYALQSSQTDFFGTSKVVLSGVRCEGNESSLFQCKHRQYGDVVCPGNTGQVAAVVCTKKLADLALNYKELESTSHLHDVALYHLQCAMEELCLTKSAYEVRRTNSNWQFETRRLLRFTASALNIGNDDFRPYLPKYLWQWHECHMHYHSMEVFATFNVLDRHGRRVAEGHKASFCLEDNTCLPGVEKKYSCKNYGDQGISVNCSDIYRYSIDCQWVDVTDLKPGYYVLNVAINPNARVAEQDFYNNAANCQLRLTETYASVYGCVLQKP